VPLEAAGARLLTTAVPFAGHGDFVSAVSANVNRERNTRAPFPGERSMAAPYSMDRPTTYPASVGPVATSSRPHGATTSQRDSHESASDHVNDCANTAGARRKRARMAAAGADEFEYDEPSDPEDRKLEKRRAKNRRTARNSRERKQAEVTQLRAQLNARAVEVSRLQQIIQMKDQQLSAMAAASSSSRGAPQPDGRGQSAKRSTSESAELDCVESSYSLLTKRLASPPTAPPSCLTTCTAPSPGEMLQALCGLLRVRCPHAAADLLWGCLGAQRGCDVVGRAMCASGGSGGSCLPAVHTCQSHSCSVQAGGSGWQCRGKTIATLHGFNHVPLVEETAQSDG
jgi:hypothetical protein